MRHDVADDSKNHDMSFMLGEINANVRNLLDLHDRHKQDTTNQFTSVHSRLNGHNDRIARVEHAYWKVIGIASVIPFVLTGIGIALSYLK